MLGFTIDVLNHYETDETINYFIVLKVKFSFRTRNHSSSENQELQHLSWFGNHDSRQQSSALIKVAQEVAYSPLPFTITIYGYLLLLLSCFDVTKTWLQHLNLCGIIML